MKCKRLTNCLEFVYKMRALNFYNLCYIGFDGILNWSHNWLEQSLVHPENAYNLSPTVATKTGIIESGSASVEL